MYYVSIDIGGAFTDLALVDEDGEISYTKVDSTTQPEDGVINAITSLDLGLKDVKSIIHGQTLVINSVIEKKGAKVGLITTKGFRDIIEIGRSNRRDIFNLNYKKPVSFVPRYLRKEIEERTSSDGKILVEPKYSEIEEISNFFKKEGVESISVCLINSYVNNSNEIKIKEYLERLGWEYVTASSKVTMEWREYERFNTAVINAFLQPKMVKYLTTLEDTFRNLGFEGTFNIMLSNGGIAPSTFVKSYPVETIESGPIGGIIGAINIADFSELEFDKENIITLDGGSTTTKSSLITSGMTKTVTEYYVGRDKFSGGYPIIVPILEIYEIGNGGTSIASLKDGSLKVGPEAAGAYPGPACYMRGGNLPTLTDAYVLSGFIDPNYFLGGKIKLSKSAAQEAIEKLSYKVNMTVNDTAEGIIRLANDNASYVLHLISIQRGYDPRDFTLIPFGGAGAMMASFIAPELKIRNILIPGIPLGVFSAWGMFFVDVRHEHVQTVLLPVDSEHLGQIVDKFEEIERYLVGVFKEEGEKSPTFIRYADMRYKGQEHTLKVELPSNFGNVKSIIDVFNMKYAMEYGYTIEGNPIEMVNIHVAGIVPHKVISLKEQRNIGNGEPKGKRKIYINGEWIEANIYDRENLIPKRIVEGPGIIEEPTSTIILMPDQTAIMDKFGNILIKVRESS